jgi:DNA-binding PadR family transcriptional regulator
VDSSWDWADSGKRAKYYSLTRKGRKELSVEREKWEKFARAMGLVLNPAGEES